MEENKYQNPLKLALLLLLIGMAVAIHQFKVPPIMVQVAGSMGATEARAPELMSVFLLVCLIFSIPAGGIVEKFSTKKVLLISAVIVGLGAVAGALSPTYGSLLASRGLEGFGFLLMSIALPVAGVKYSHPQKVGFVMGIAGVWISVGSIVAFNTVPLMDMIIGWRGVWLIYLTFTLLAVGVFWMRFESEYKIHTRFVAESGAGGSLKDAFRNRDLLIGAFGFLTFNFNLLSMITFFPIHAEKTGLLDLNRAAFIASLPMILSLISSPLFGRLADKVGHKWLYSIAVLCSGIGAWMMFSISSGTVMTGAFILGLIGAASPPLVFSSMGKLVPDGRLLAKSNSIVVLFQNSGMFLASFGFGKLAIAMGNNYSKAGLLLLPLSILAAVLILRINYNKNEIGA